MAIRQLGLLAALVVLVAANAEVQVDAAANLVCCSLCVHIPSFLSTALQGVESLGESDELATRLFDRPEMSKDTLSMATTPLMYCGWLSSGRNSERGCWSARDECCRARGDEAQVCQAGGIDEEPRPARVSADNGTVSTHSDEVRLLVLLPEPVSIDSSMSG